MLETFHTQQTPAASGIRRMAEILKSASLQGCDTAGRR
jgi:hypothetical protein